MPLSNGHIACLLALLDVYERHKQQLQQINDNNQK